MLSPPPPRNFRRHSSGTSSERTAPVVRFTYAIFRCNMAPLSIQSWGLGVRGRGPTHSSSSAGEHTGDDHLIVGANRCLDVGHALTADRNHIGVIQVSRLVEELRAHLWTELLRHYIHQLCEAPPRELHRNLALVQNHAKETVYANAHGHRAIPPLRVQ